MNDNNELWIHLEQYQKRFENVSLEILGKARELADANEAKLTCVIMGNNIAPLAYEAIHYGADRVFMADDPLLESYRTDAYASVLTKLVQTYQPSMLLMGATYDGRDLAGRIAVQLRTGLTADAVRLSLNGEGLVAYTPGFGGRILAACICPDARPQMVTVRPGIFSMPERDQDRTGTVEQVPVTLSASDIRTEVLERVVGESIDLTQAERVIAAGLGTGGNLDSIQELAKLISADVGVTRPIVDGGWAAREYQVGTTGVSVSPKLLITAGVSGAMHFTGGIEGSETIIAINTDPDAVIFEQADYCVVDNLFEVLPRLIKLIKN